MHDGSPFQARRRGIIEGETDVLHRRDRRGALSQKSADVLGNRRLAFGLPCCPSHMCDRLFELQANTEL